MPYEKNNYSFLGIILLGYAFNEFSPFEKKLITNFTARIRELQQEKVYLHTDKSVYTVGDKLWFRAYQVHAAATFPMVFSHYIYVDLIDRRDSVIQRVKVAERDSCFFGQIEIPKDLQQGIMLCGLLRIICRMEGGLFFSTKRRSG